MKPAIFSFLAFTLLSGLSLTTQADDKLLDNILSNQPESVQQRYPYRNPKQTLEFFAIQPGMTVVEVLPGGGWYSKILLPLLGDQGHLIGADYALDMFPRFNFFSQDFLDKKKTWIPTWIADAQSWRNTEKTQVSAFVLGSLPQEMKNSADAVLFIRALHNLNRFEKDGGYMTTALQNTYDVLKPGGIVGVVQHHAREDMSDDWANGSKGYLKKSHVIALFEKAGFTLVAESEVNANSKDQPTEQDIVWRLPPRLVTSNDNPELRAELTAIGESNRMTLRFQKPE